MKNLESSYHNVDSFLIFERSYNLNSVVYDNNGNVTSGPLNGQMTSFAYNSRSK